MTMNSPEPSAAQASLPGSAVHGGRGSDEIVSTFLRAAVLSGHVNGDGFSTNGNGDIDAVDERKVS